jgi:hypothetical protein
MTQDSSGRPQGKQGLDVLEYLTECCRATLGRTAPLALLPRP